MLPRRGGNFRLGGDSATARLLRHEDVERKYNKSRVTLGLHGFAMLGSLLGLRRRLGIVWRLGEVYGMYLLRRGGLGLGIEDISERTIVVFPLSR